MTSDVGLLTIARLFLFVREVTKNGMGTNTGRWVEAIQRIGGTVKGQPWCACFVCAVLGLVHGGKLPFPYTASCDHILDWAKKNDRVIDRPEPGCLFLLLRSNDDAVHVGFVSDDIVGRKFGTLEGNASDPEQPATRDGFGVFERTTQHNSCRTIGKEYIFVRYA